MVNVLFASGVIRTPYRFMHSIEDMFNNKNVKKIVLTVWKNEIDKYKNLRNFLKERNVIIIELDEPLTKTTGYIDHQMISYLIFLLIREALLLYCYNLNLTKVLIFSFLKLLPFFLDLDILI